MGEAAILAFSSIATGAANVFSGGGGSTTSKQLPPSGRFERQLSGDLSFQGLSFGSRGEAEELIARLSDPNIEDDSEFLNQLEDRFGNDVNPDDPAVRQQIVQSLQQQLDSGIDPQKGGQVQQDFDSFRDFLEAGAGREDVVAGTQAQRDFASFLGGQTGAPSQGDITNAQGFAQDIFGAQQEALNQRFEDQRTQNTQQAAILGRGPNDPVLRNKLAQTQGREQALLSSQQTAFSAGAAQDLLSRRIQARGGQAQVLGGLSNQAQSNRLALLNAGSNLQAGERQFRLSQASETTQKNSSAVGDFITGGIAGLGVGQSFLRGQGSPGGIGQTSGGFGAQNFNIGPSSRPTFSGVDFLR